MIIAFLIGMFSTSTTRALLWMTGLFIVFTVIMTAIQVSQPGYQIDLGGASLARIAVSFIMDLIGLALGRLVWKWRNRRTERCASS